MIGTNRSFLLDTNAAIALLEGDSGIESLLSGANASIPSIALGELYFGAEKSGRVEANLRRIDEFAIRRNVLVCDRETARWYGRISQQLRAKGKPIPKNDVWIAAIALQHGLSLVTRDEHFNHVPDLQIEAW